MDFFDIIKNNKLIILITSIALNIVLTIAGGIILYLYLNHECICVKSSLLSEPMIEEECADAFFVEIKGAVKKPGVYKVNNDNIINDVVNMAGGFNKKAYTKNINLSRKVSPELVIYVFTETEYKKANTKVVQNICDCSTYDISNCTNNSVSEIVSSNKDTSFSDDNEDDTKGKLININSALKEELMTLSGIGEAKANDIIEHRNTKGQFKNIEDIKNVSGIGDSLFEKIKNNITV